MTSVPSRVFFMVTGVCQTSRAPASKRRSTASAMCSAPRWSMAVTSSTTGSVARHSVSPATACPAGSPTIRRATLGMPGISRLPAPCPIAEGTIDGMGPNEVTQVRTSAAPVGVVASPVAAPASTGMPVTRSAVAGAGTGRVPCAVRTVPLPRATGPQTRLESPRSSKAAHAPTTSAIESMAPTSWKCTSPGVVPCTSASAAASNSKVARVREATVSVRPADSSSSRMSRHVRGWGRVPVETCTERAATPPRFTVSKSMRIESSSERTAPFTTSRDAPAPTSAARNLSPEIPLVQSRYPITFRSPRMLRGG